MFGTFKLVLPYQPHLLPSLVLSFLLIHLHLNMTFDGLLLLLSSVLLTRTISHILIFAFEFIISIYTSSYFFLLHRLWINNFIYRNSYRKKKPRTNLKTHRRRFSKILSMMFSARATFALYLSQLLSPIHIPNCKTWAVFTFKKKTQTKMHHCGKAENFYN